VGPLEEPLERALRRVDRAEPAPERDAHSPAIPLPRAAGEGRGGGPRGGGPRGGGRLLARREREERGAREAPRLAGRDRGGREAVEGRRGGDRRPVREDAREGGGLRAVVVLRAGSVRVHVADGGRLDARVAERGADRLLGAAAGRVGRRDVMGLARRAVAEEA